MISIKDIPTDILVAVRKRLGAESDTDTFFDERIKQMTPKELMARWSGWKLGDEYWARHIIEQYEFLKSVYVQAGDSVDIMQEMQDNK